jgi:hypothetical protein
MPTEILITLAGASVAFAGLSALSMVVVQLASVEWRPDMTTGLWLMLAWSLGAFAFSILPLLLLEFGLSQDVVTSIVSAGLGIFVIVVSMLAIVRDGHLLKRGAEAPLRTMIIGGGLAVVIAIGLFLNSLSILPGARQAWYVGGVFTALIYAMLPLGHLVLSLKQKD